MIDGEDPNSLEKMLSIIHFGDDSMEFSMISNIARILITSCWVFENKMYLTTILDYAMLVNMVLWFDCRLRYNFDHLIYIDVLVLITRNTRKRASNW